MVDGPKTDASTAPRTHVEPRGGPLENATRRLKCHLFSAISCLACHREEVETKLKLMQPEEVRKNSLEEL